MDKLSLQNPLFATYVIAATLMILKVVGMSWLTVVRMLQVNGGFRSPEDLRKTPLNPSPDPKQLDRNRPSTASAEFSSMIWRMSHSSLSRASFTSSPSRR